MVGVVQSIDGTGVLTRVYLLIIRFHDSRRGGIDTPDSSSEFQRAAEESGDFLLTVVHIASGTRSFRCSSFEITQALGDGPSFL